MHKYYFKIKKGDTEFEFSTSDQAVFDEQLSYWSEKMTTLSEFSEADASEFNPVAQEIETENPAPRKDFIDIEDRVSINEIQNPITKNIKTFEPEKVFDNILSDSMKSPKTNVIEQTEVISPFKTFLSVFNPQEPLDYLILAAKYLSDNENVLNFSLKQVNSKIVPITKKPIGHKVIDEALKDRLIMVVPDYTNIGEVTEYTLTQAGEGYFVE